MEIQPTPLFKIHPSSCGKIMGGIGKPTEKQLITLAELEAKPKLTEKQQITLSELIAKRDAKPNLSAGAKTYLQKWMKEQLYGRTQEFSSQYTEKGILCEPAAIEFVARMMGYGEIEKNTVTIENEWMVGTCDLNLAKIVEDIKNSWDIFTFPLFATELPDSDYFYQLQCYAKLYDKPRAAVNYCLIDAPEEIIDQVARSVSYKAGFSEVDMQLYEEVRLKMTYPDIHPRLKLKRFEFDRDETVIEAICGQVELCRKYVNEEWPKIFESASKLLEV